MNRHSEVEVKFGAAGVSVAGYHRFIRDTKLTNCAVQDYKVVSGSDTYYRLGAGVIRYRSDGGGGVLTFKERKSNGSIMDRVEIDLPFAESVQPRDVVSVLKHLKAEKLFKIDKVSYIYRTRGIIRGQMYEATAALYDVKTASGAVDRYLEVEVERDNKCSPKLAVLALEEWVSAIKSALTVTGPLNKSLFEIYTQEKH